jgi:hypothetical protein
MRPQDYGDGLAQWAHVRTSSYNQVLILQLRSPDSGDSKESVFTFRAGVCGFRTGVCESLALLLESFRFARLHSVTNSVDLCTAETRATTGLGSGQLVKHERTGKIDFKSGQNLKLHAIDSSLLNARGFFFLRF